MSERADATAKSCSRCGNRAKEEGVAGGHLLLSPYYDLTKAYCSVCVGELARRHDRDGWPEDPLGEIVWDSDWPTDVEDFKNRSPVTPATPRAKDSISLMKTEKKMVTVHCVGGPHKELDCYGTIPYQVPFSSGRYDYDGERYRWTPGGPE